MKYTTMVLAFLAVACAASCAYCQEKAEYSKIQTVTGTLTKVDFAGSLIVVNTGSDQMAFSVPDDANITGGMEDLGLAGLKESDPVTVQYYSPVPGQYVVVNVMDNNVADE